MHISEKKKGSVILNSHLKNLKKDKKEQNLPKAKKGEIKIKAEISEIEDKNRENEGNQELGLQKDQ